MSHDSKPSNLNRLTEAVRLLMIHRAGGQQDDAEFLQAHPTMRDLLEPMLEEDAAEWQEDPANSAVGAVAPRILGDFRLIRELARGGMGVVHEAEQISLSRRVALKLLPLQATASARQIERFRREAASASRLRHPNVASIFEIGEQDGVHFYAMELVAGLNLGEVLQRLRDTTRDSQFGGKPAGVIPLDRRPHFEQIADLIAKVADGLAAAHEEGVIHRDIKPQNILLTEDAEPKIVDFGLAKDTARQSISISGELAGTPSYMSPEQVLSLSDVDHRTDIFSLGAVLYELLTLRQAFEGAGTQAIMQAVGSKEPRLPRRDNPRFPMDLQTICLKALEKQPKSRYQSASELGQDLRRFLAGEPILAQPGGTLHRLWKLARRRQALTAAIALGALLLVGTPIVWWVLEHRAGQRLQRQRDTAAAEAEVARAATQTQMAEQRRQTRNILRQHRAEVHELIGQPGLTRKLRSMAQRLNRSYEQLYDQDHQSFATRYDVVEALREEAVLHIWLGARQKAAACLQQALDHADKLVRDFSEEQRSWFVRGCLLMDKAALVNGESGDGPEQSEKEIARAIADLARVAGAVPSKHRAQNQLFVRQAQIIQLYLRWNRDRGLSVRQTQQDMQAALAALQGAFDDLPPGKEQQLHLRMTRRTTQFAHEILAKTHLRLGQTTAAGEQIGKALALLDKRLAEQPNHVHLVLQRGGLLMRQSEWHIQRGARRAGINSCQAAIDAAGATLASDPHLVGLQRRRLRAMVVKGSHLAQFGRRKTALQTFEQAQAVLKDLPAEVAGTEELRRVRAQVFTGHAASLLGVGQISQAASLLKQALTAQQSLAAARPGSVSLHNDLAFTWRNLAGMHYARKDREAAFAAMQEALVHRRRAHQATVDDRRQWRLLTGDLNQTMKMLVNMRRPADVLPLGIELRQLQREDPKQLLQMAGLFANCHGMAQFDGNADPAFLARCEQEVATSLKMAVAKGFRDQGLLRRIDVFRKLRKGGPFQQVLRLLDDTLKEEHKDG